MNYEWKDLSEALNIAIRTAPPTKCETATLFHNMKGNGYVMFSREFMEDAGWKEHETLLVFNDYAYCSIVKTP